MKTIGTAAALIGAVSLMLAIIVAQQNYQRSWTADGIAQASVQSENAPAITPPRSAMKQTCSVARGCAAKSNPARRAKRLERISVPARDQTRAPRVREAGC